MKEKGKENKRQEKKKELEKELEIKRGHHIINELKARGKEVGCLGEYHSDPFLSYFDFFLSSDFTVFTERCMIKENCRVTVKRV